MICAMIHSMGAYAQEWRLSLDQVDSLFLSQNLRILAADIRVQAQRALEIQARAYPSPQFEIMANLRDPENERWMHWGPSGQKSLGLEQVILLGGKRRLEWELASQDTRMAEWELEDLLRHLRFRLHCGFYRIHQLGEQLEAVEDHIEKIRPIRAQFALQVGKGDLALKDALRLESVYMDLLRMKTEWNLELQDLREEMAILLHDQRPFQPVGKLPEADHFVPFPPLDSLISLSLDRRPDLRMAQWAVEQARTRLRWERIQRVPDLTLMAHYDQMGGAFGREVNLGFSLPLPLWNRQKGRMEFRFRELDREETLLEAKSREVESEVRRAWQRFRDCLNAYREAELVFDHRYDQVLEGMKQSLLNRHVSILEFVDFLESYQQSRIQSIQFHHELLIACEALNHAVAGEIY